MRRVRSFVRRPGRITTSQARALVGLMPRFGIEVSDEPIELDAVFGRRAPHVLDVGFGDGETLLTSAASHPGVDFLGVEVHEPGVGHLLVMLERTGLTNVRIIQRDVVDVLATMITEPAFDVVNIFFPDPWPKKRHHKRRLIQPEFAAMLARRMRPGALLHVATDWSDYAVQIGAVLDAADELSACAAAEIAAQPLAERSTTKFERRGLRRGHAVTELFYSRHR